MDKDIRDYLHLYIGSDVYDPERTDELGEPDPLFPFSWANSQYVRIGIYEGRFKLALRPVSDMNQEELIMWTFKSNSYQSYAARVKYCLDRHIDLFGLIEAGLAIDKTKI